MKTLSSRLSRTALSTFEELGFVCPDEEMTEAQAEVELACGARVAFSGPVSGWVEILASRDVIRTVATNMLGPEMAEEESVQRDALGEIANVICGNFVPSLGDPTDVFDLSAPQVWDVAGEVSAAAVEHDLGIEEGRVRVRLWLAEAVVAP